MSAEKTTPTSQEIIDTLNATLGQHFGGMIFKVSNKPRLGNEDFVHVVYASVHKDAGELAALNAQSNPMFKIEAASGHRWHLDQPAPAKVVVEKFRGSLNINRDYSSRLKFRAKTGTPDLVIKYLIDFFMKNKDVLLKNDRL